MALWLSPFEHLVRVRSGLYLESGFYDLRSSGKCTADAYKPALLQYDSETASYVTGVTTPLQGSVTLVRKFWEVDTAYLVGARITPFSESDLAEIWECVVGGTSGSANPVWDSATPGNITTDGPDVQWQYDPGFDGGLVEEPFTGEALVEGMDSASVGCETLATEVTDPCGTNWVSQVGPAYCPNVFPKKDAQYKVPSSTYSGKLRLFVQALYGSKRDDYTVYGTSLKVGGSDNEHPVKILQKGFSGSGWIYTTDSYDYFYCEWAGASVNFYALDISKEAERFRDTLKLHTNTDYEFVKKVEAFILSTANIQKDPTHIVPVTGAAVLGSPLDYGWHTNWKGSEASIVTFYKDPLNPQYLSTLHKLDITESWDEVAYTFTVSNTPTVTDAPWWPWTNGLHVFYYDEAEQSMVPVEYPAPIFGGYNGTFDSPLYCYYAHDELTGDDELIIVNIFMDVPNYAPNEFFDLAHGARFSSPQRFLTYKSEVVHTQGGNGRKGFKVGASVVEVTLTSKDKSREISYYPASGPTYVFGLNGWSSLAYDVTSWAAANGVSIGETKDIYDPEFDAVFTCQWGWTSKFLFMGKEDQGNIGQHGTSGSLFCEVVLGDCSNVVTGETTDSFADEETFHTIVETHASNSGQLIAFDGDLSWYIPIAYYGYKKLEEIAGPPPDQAMVYDAFASFPNATVILDERIPAFSDAYTTGLNTHDKGALKNVVSNADAGNPEYFAPTVSDKPTHTVDTARRSIGNKYKVNHDAFDDDGGFLNDSSVGWT